MHGDVDPQRAHFHMRDTLLNFLKIFFIKNDASICYHIRFHSYPLK